MFDLRCSCGKYLRVPATAIGQLGKCPFCKQKLRLIAAGELHGPSVFTDRLVIEQAPERMGEQLLIGGADPIEIGKLPGKHLLLRDPRISRSHCRLMRAADGSWIIEDQKSTFGVSVNDQRIQKHPLSDGDRIRIGDTTLLFYCDGRAPAPTVSTAAVPDSESESLDVDALYQLIEGEEIQLAPEPTIQEPEAPPIPADGPICPSCQKQFPSGAKVCTSCGIDLKTGRPILTAYDADLDAIYARAENTIGLISWIIWSGLYPIASEAFGTRKPYVIWTTAILTCVTSLLFLGYEWSRSPSMRTMKNYMLWAGEAPPTAEVIGYYYLLSNYGDSDAFEQRLEQLTEKKAQTPVGRMRRAPRQDDTGPVLDAYRELTPSQRCLGTYQPSQLITYAFIHGGLMHLAGNILFLLVIGSRVNALIGNLATVVLYPLLAAAGGWAYMVSSANQPPHPLVGASGAIMGMAGMYLILMPMHKVHMAAWFRLGLLFGFRLRMALFALRGLWVVIFYIIFDVLFTIFGVEDGVAHWAHLGGFILGVVVALLLLITRLVNCRSGDILSGIFGRYAWPLVGRPDSSRKSIIAGWF